MKPNFIFILLFIFSVSISAGEANAQNRVTIYKDCNFNGNSQTLTPGQYNLKDTRIGGSGLSSLRIPRGIKVTLYSGNDIGRGSQITLDNDAECLRDVNWNDKANFIVVETFRGRGARWNRQNNHNFDDNRVTVYDNDDYRGNRLTLGTGRFRAEQLHFGSDIISSIRIPEGWSVTLYDNDNFKGTSRTFSSSVNSIPSNLRDKTSSLIITRNGYTNGDYDDYIDGNRDNQNGDSDIDVNRGDGVVVYTDHDFNGQRNLLHCGRFHVNELGVDKNMISSIRVPEGWTITVYEDDNFRGAKKVYNSSERCVSEFWKHKISSVYVSRNRSGEGIL